MADGNGEDGIAECFLAKRDEFVYKTVGLVVLGMGWVYI